MAESIITKKALATSLKDLLETMPFETITIADICEGCGMNRKSFYYHFRDKYDLVNWIFDTEFLEIARDALDPNCRFGERTRKHWRSVREICNYLYENRSFYQKVLTYRGQNSLSDHSREVCYPIFAHRMALTLENVQEPSVMIEFLADAVICAIERWITAKDPIPPQELLSSIRTCLEGLHNITIDFDLFD